MPDSLLVHQFPCRTDNYGYLIHDPKTRATAAIDTPEVGPIKDALAEKGWELTHILNTHHHGDHTGGNLELKESTNCTIVGPKADAERIPGIDIQVGDADEVEFGALRARVFDTPGHTKGHICFYFESEKVAFVGDTLFALGCGRMFEGTADQMWSSLSKLRELPDETVIYCAHEYTQANARFAVTVEPDNKILMERAARIDELRSQNIPTVPFTIAEERATNPFLRPDSVALQRTIGLEGADLVSVFAKTRALKDSF